MGFGKAWSAAIIGCCLAILPGSSGGQSILTFQNEVVTWTGGPVPGVPGAGFFPGSPASLPFLQDDGRVFFQAQFFGGGAQQGSTDRALFHGDRASLAKVLRWGDAEPSGTIAGATISQIFNDLPLGANGAMMFGGRVVGPGITFSNDGVLYAGVPGSFQLIAREGSQAPDSPPGTIVDPSQDFGQTTGILNTNASGHVAFTLRLSGGLNGTAVFGGLPGALTRILTMGEVVGTNLTVNSVPDLVQINSAGQVLMDLVNYQSVTIGSQTIVGPDNNAAIWLYTPGSGKQQILREGQTSPIAGAKFADLIHGGTTLKCGFNANGQALIRCGLANIGTSTAVTFGVNDQVIMLVSAASQTLVARKGDSAPGIPGATLQLPNGDIELRLNDSGLICFSSQIGGAGVTQANDTAMWVGAPGNLTLVAREGNVAPGTGGLTFGEMPGSKLLNDAGQVVFISNLNGGATPLPTIWSFDPSAGLQLLFSINDTVQVTPGNFQPAGFCAFLPHSSGDSRPPSFANDGTLAMQTNVGIVKTRIGSLTGTPREISAAAGGTHSLFLNATATHAGESYLVAGSVSGTSPGVQVGPFQVPLNLDFYTDMMLASPNAGPFGNTVGTLNASGCAIATITIPPGIPGISGLVLNHVFGALNGSNAITFVSEPSSLTILP